MINTFNIVRGQPATLQTVFIDKNIPVTYFDRETPSWTILDYDLNVVLTGNGVQNTNHPEEWLAFFTIPDSAPVDVDRKYCIQWYVNVNGHIYKNTEYFTVIDQAEPMAEDSSYVMLVSDNFRASLLTSLEPKNLRIQIVTDTDSVIYKCDDLNLFTIKRDSGAWRVDFDSKANISALKEYNLGAYPYIVQWTYDTDVRTNNTEFQMCYVINAKMVLYVNNMKRYLDKSRNYDINPNLRWTDAELVHFLMMGVNRINSYPPTMTSWTINTIPPSLTYILEKCAEVEALNALYLAEGFSAFDFQGASTSLNVDRTQYISYKIDEINSFLSENLSNIKRTLLRSSGAGVLSLSITPVTNNNVRVGNSFILSRLIRWGSYLM